MARWSQEKKYKRRRAIVPTLLAVVYIIASIALENFELMAIAGLLVILSIVMWVIYLAS